MLLFFAYVGLPGDLDTHRKQLLVHQAMLGVSTAHTDMAASRNWLPLHVHNRATSRAIIYLYE